MSFLKYLSYMDQWSQSPSGPDGMTWRGWKTLNLRDTIYGRGVVMLSLENTAPVKVD